MSLLFFSTLLSTLLSTFMGCSTPQKEISPIAGSPIATSPNASPKVISSGQDPSSNPVPLDQNCVQHYQADRNYFPDTVELTHAHGFKIEYHQHYKVVTVSTPWANASQSFQYVLVQCGTPVPSGFAAAQIVTIPVQRVIVLSTTHLPFFDRLNTLSHIVGIRQIQEVNNPTIRDEFKQGKITAVGTGNDLNFERIVSLKPDLVTTFGIANVETNSIHRLQELNIPTAVISEYLEADPLGQAEWIKFIAAFLNQEQQANQIFKTIVQEYNGMRALTQAVKSKPTVLTGFNLQGTWYVAGGKSFIAQFIADAGGRYLWQGNQNTGNLPLDFEAVFAKGSQANIWINANPKWKTIADAVTEDDRYQRFLALRSQQVFNNDARLNPEGGNDYWESGVVNPQTVLADLIKIIHPDLLPNHQLFYYRIIK